MPNAPLPDTAVTRLRDDVLRLTDGEGARFGVAVSGGPDSMALLALMAAAFPGAVEGATVDHALRPDSADEAAMVAEWCAGEGVPHATLPLDNPISGNLQSEARAARYAVLERWRVERGLDWLLTAHHADDQCETVLMRLNRASGVAGLAAVRARRGNLLRPLLGWRRNDLASVVEAGGLPSVQDPSNTNPRFDRAALRQHLANAEWLNVDAIARSAAALADAEQALCWIVDGLVAEHVREEGGAITLDRGDFPPELQRRLLLRLLAQAGEPAPRGEALDRLLATVRAGGQASIGAHLCSGGAQWSIRPAPPRRIR